MKKLFLSMLLMATTMLGFGASLHKQHLQSSQEMKLCQKTSHNG